MVGALLADLRENAASIINSEGFETDITVTDKAAHSATIKGIATIHHTAIDPQTMLQVSIRQAHVVLAIADLVTAGISVFSDIKEPTLPVLRGFTVSFVDGFGKTQLFIIEDARPSATFGAVTCALGKKK